MVRFSDIGVIVTGAASGIGAAVARAFAGEGARVWCLDRDGVEARELARDIGGEAYELDITDESGWEDFEAQRRGDGSIRVMAHCAGVSAASPFLETSLEEWRRVLAVNLDGAFLATRTALRLFADRGGAVVLVGSASGIRPAAGATAYSVSKAGLSMLARTVAKELRDARPSVRVNVVSPAGVRTNLWRQMPFFEALVEQHGSVDAAFRALEIGGGSRFLSPEEVANVVLFLASADAEAITGTELPVDSGYVL